MAFRQPALATSQRPSIEPEITHSHIPIQVQQEGRIEESQEWVLFPTPQPRTYSQTHTASTAYTPQTAGLSRLSEFGSLNTATRSGFVGQDETTFEDDEELDSLDEGLLAFQSQSGGQELGFIGMDGSILPTHDGLGTFPASSRPIQEHLWQYEQFNPHRKSFGHSRRRSSVQRRLTAAEVDDNVRIEKERLARIEKWRSDQSRILLEEVEKESRGWNRNQLTEPYDDNVGKLYESCDIALSRPSLSESIKLEKSTSDADAKRIETSDTFWNRITKRVICDLMGLDDATISIIFGETLASEETQTNIQAMRALQPPVESSNTNAICSSSQSWKTRLLDRLARDIEFVLRHISGKTINSTTAMSPWTLDYAGIPVNQSVVSQAKALPIILPEEAGAGTEFEADPNPTPLFNPTIQGPPLSSASDSAHAGLWGIEEEALDSTSAMQDREYWEQTPSIKTIFRFIHHRFTSQRRPLSSSGSLSNKASNIATSYTTDSLRRTAIVRQHHPLVSRQYSRRAISGGLLNPHHPQHSSNSIPKHSSALFRRSEGSCASLSVRRARKASSGSRNYWDIGGSIGSGSVGGIGPWGEA